MKNNVVKKQNLNSSSNKLCVSSTTGGAKTRSAVAKKIKEEGHQHPEDDEEDETKEYQCYYCGLCLHFLYYISAVCLH